MQKSTRISAIFGEWDWKDKSLWTNLISLFCFIAGLYSPIAGKQLQDIGSYALSGAITNWLAIYMLFEKVPGLYGSGIIPLKFNEFKRGIQKLIMTEFFTRENLERFLGDKASRSFEADLILKFIDKDLLFQKLMQAVSQSSFGPMLAMFGGAPALEAQLKKPFSEKIDEAILEIIGSDRFHQLLQQLFQQNASSDSLLAQIEEVVAKRLDELTPDLVKKIIQDMIRSHLGWLVIWGGVFGGLLGLFASFF